MFLDTRTISSSTEFTSFLLNMCIEASESTTFFLSFGFVQGWRCQAPNIRRREECSFVLSLYLKNTFCPFQRVSASASCLLQGFFFTSILKFRSMRAAPSRAPVFRITPCEGPFLSRIFTWRNVTFGTCTLRFGANDLVPS